MSRERDKKAMDLSVQFVSLFNLSEKEKSDLTDRIGQIYKLGELRESINRYSDKKQE